MIVILFRYNLYLVRKTKFRVTSHFLYNLSRTFMDFCKPEVIHGLYALCLILAFLSGACLLLTLLKIWRNLV